MNGMDNHIHKFTVVLEIEANEAKWATERDYALGDLWNGTSYADLMDYIESSVQLAYPDNAVSINEVKVTDSNPSQIPIG